MLSSGFFASSSIHYDFKFVCISYLDHSKTLGLSMKLWFVMIKNCQITVISYVQLIDEFLLCILVSECIMYLLLIDKFLKRKKETSSLFSQNVVQDR